MAHVIFPNFQNSVWCENVLKGNEKHIYYINTVSSNNAIPEFSLANWRLWVMSHCTMLYKYGKHMHNFLWAFLSFD